jgi:hypothetical protein
MSLLKFSETEHQLLKDAAAKYGAAWANAEDVTLTLSNVVQIPIVPCDAFLRFYSQVKKYHTLSILSTVRLHRVQAKLDLRYCIESVANAAFALAHPDTDNYYDVEKEVMADAKKASVKAYKWLDEKYPAFSARLKEFKDHVNEETAHAHVINSAHNFDITTDADIVTSFFDFDYELEAKMDLWLAAKAGIEAIALLLAVQKTYGVIIPHRDTDALPQLMAANDAVHTALLAENRSPGG